MSNYNNNSPPRLSFGRSNNLQHAAASRLLRASTTPRAAVSTDTTAISIPKFGVPTNISVATSSIPEGLEVGARVFLQNTKVYGTVRYLGETAFAPQVWAGLELDVPEGKNDGSKNGTRYFDCRPHHGLFVRPEKCVVMIEGALAAPAHATSTTATTPRSGRFGSPPLSAHRFPGSGSTLRLGSPRGVSNGASGIVLPSMGGGARLGGVPTPSPHAAPANEDMMIELLVERVMQSAVLQEKLQEHVEEETQAQLKAAEARLVSRLMGVMNAVSTRLESLEGKIEAAVSEAQQAASASSSFLQQQHEPQHEAANPPPSSDGPSHTAQEQALALEAILGLARQAKMAILEDVRERCEAMALAD